MFVECRKMIVAKEDRHRPRSQLILKLIKSERTQLRRIINLGKLLDRLDIIHGLLFLEGQRPPFNYATLKFFFSEMQQLDVFMVLSHSHKCCMGLCSRIGHPTMYQQNVECAIKFNITCLVKTSNVIF